MHFEILTAVPDLVKGYLSGSILGRAAAAGVVSSPSALIAPFFLPFAFPPPRAVGLVSPDMPPAS